MDNKQYKFTSESKHAENERKRIWHGTINGEPIPKKNSQRIVNAGGHPRIIQSQRYLDYERKALDEINPPTEAIGGKVNVKLVYYRTTKRRCDLVNLQEATLDILVKYKVLTDDNFNVVASMDGSTVFIDKLNPRVEIEITEWKT